MIKYGCEYNNWDINFSCRVFDWSLRNNKIICEVIMGCKTCLGCNKQEDNINIAACVNCIADKQLEQIEKDRQKEIVEERKKIFEAWKRKKSI